MTLIPFCVECSSLVDLETERVLPCGCLHFKCSDPVCAAQDNGGEYIVCDGCGKAEMAEWRRDRA